MARGALSKTAIWLVRFFQLVWAVILTGVFAWFHHRITDNQGFSTSRAQVNVPLGVSVVAIFFTALSIITVFCLRGSFDYIFAFADFALFGGYLASAILYRRNYSIRCRNNELPYLLSRRNTTGGFRGFASCNLVRLGAALIIIQLVLFFFTFLMSLYLARHHSRERAAEPITTEKGGFFGRRKRSAATYDSRGSTVAAV